MNLPHTFHRIHKISLPAKITRELSERCHMSQFAPHRHESDPTCTIPERVPQRDRSDTRKVPRGLRGQYQNSHCVTTRVIWHAQSHERVARAHTRFLQLIAGTTKNEHWCYMFHLLQYIALSYIFWSRSTMYVACHDKWASAAPATRNHQHVENQNWRQFRKTTLDLSKRRPTSRHTKWPPKPSPILTYTHQRFSNV